MHIQKAACQRERERAQEICWCDFLFYVIVSSCKWRYGLTIDMRLKQPVQQGHGIRTEMLIQVQRLEQSSHEERWASKEDCSMSVKVLAGEQEVLNDAGPAKYSQDVTLQYVCMGQETRIDGPLGGGKQKGQSCQWLWHISAVYKRSRLSIRTLLRSALHISCPAGGIVPGLMSTVSCVITLFIWPSPMQQICLV